MLDIDFAVGTKGMSPETSVSGEHLIPPQMSWITFQTYRARLNRLLDDSASHH